jgi:hypothetical protein
MVSSFLSFLFLFGAVDKGDNGRIQGEVGRKGGSRPEGSEKEEIRALSLTHWLPVSISLQRLDMMIRVLCFKGLFALIK